MEGISNRKIYIFGAHSRSQTLGVYLKSLYPGTEILAYLVDNDEENPADVDGVPVIDIRGFDSAELSKDIDTSLPVYIGTRGIYHKAISERLKALSFEEIIPVTPEVDKELRNAYISCDFESGSRSFVKMDDKGAAEPSVCIYVARSVFDKELKNSYKSKRWEKYIQAGCDLTDERLLECTFFDNDGWNISNRNRQFCELTALYWIWRNAREDVVGLEHYRRHFTLEDDWISYMQEKDIDVILPVPLYVHPSLAKNYRKRHTKRTWNAMLSVLRRQPDIYIEAMDFFENTGCYSPCNMLIARKEVLNKLCEWLFPIIFEVTGQIGELDDAYQNRYPGFLSERLITFFFYYYRDKYKTVYADKDFRE